DGDVNRFPDGDGDGDGDEAEKQGWGCMITLFNSLGTFSSDHKI
ncbi:hypothetical protein Tco_0494987, partial [Tanacetum coccineum]